MNRWILISLIFIPVIVLPGVLYSSPEKETIQDESSDSPNSSEFFKNSYPIILVHGFMGFERNPENRFFYWGGSKDLQEELKQEGFDVRTASAGPVSSNWDRACELYAYIKGGRVDYGKTHSEKFGHARYGRTYRGIYPEWGETDPETGEINKIHIVSHSMGGQTARMLAQLLWEKTNTEFTEGVNPSVLFTGSHPWISSITTISTPHDGTSLTRAVKRNPRVVYDILINLTSLHTKQISLNQNFISDIKTWNIQNKNNLLTEKIVSAKENIQLISIGRDEKIFDIKLDQWDIYHFKGETQEDYRKRIWKSPVWNNTRDISSWDLCPEGAAELNGWVKAAPDVYYFSWATEESTSSILNSWQLPELEMNPFLKAPSFFLGSYTDRKEGQPEVEKLIVDKTWWENDGVVNTNSMDGPSLNSTDRIVPYSGIPVKGVWNYMGKLPSMDHGDIIGIMASPFDIPPGYDKLTDWYADQCRLLWSLPIN